MFIQKKVDKKNQILLITLIIVYFFLFLSTCGLDTFYVINSPTETIKTPNYVSEEYSDKVFTFYTNENNSDLGSFTFLGTDVYYKIYNSSSQMTSDISNLNALANDSEQSVNSADRMITSYKYQPLEIREDRDRNPLVPKAENKQKIEIRLSNYQDIYKAQVIIDGREIGVPVRNNVSNSSFDFGRKTTFDKKPENDDEDVKFSSGSEEKEWFIALYAVGVGRDNNFTNYYSTILHLGTVKIDSTTEDN